MAIETIPTEIQEARNEAATVRRAYLHEKHRAETAIAKLRSYDSRQADLLASQAYRGKAESICNELVSESSDRAKPYCPTHRVEWDEQQAEESDRCVDCGRTRPEHRAQCQERATPSPAAIIRSARNDIIEDCARIAAAHEEWANDPGRLTEEERRLIVGATQIIAREIRALKTGPEWERPVKVSPPEGT